MLLAFHFEGHAHPNLNIDIKPKKTIVMIINNVFDDHSTMVVSSSHVLLARLLGNGVLPSVAFGWV